MQKPHVTFKFNDGQEFELQLVDGVKGLVEGPSTPSTLGVSGGGSRYGDFEPNFSHLEQRTWIGGRGLENYTDDQTRYCDAQAVWGLTEDKLFPAPLWRFAQGLRTTDDNLSTSKSFKKLYGASEYIEVSTGAHATADKANLWIRRRGNPGTLTLEVQGDTTGDPDGSAVKTVTKTIADVTDTISVFLEFDWATTTNIGDGDHLVLYGASTDEPDNCWEVAVDTSGSDSQISTDGTSWAAAGYSMLYRLTDADIKRKWLDFELEGAKYVVSVNDDGSASKVYINGGRGTASSGSTTTLVDTGIGWTADRFINAWVKIIGGTGQGQIALITDNTTDTLTFAALSIAPDNTSRYVIYKTPWFTEVSTTGLGTVKSVAVLDNVVYFAQGPNDPIRKMIEDGDGTYSFADNGTEYADILAADTDYIDGPVMWRAINGTTMAVSRADTVAWGSDLSWGDNISVGSKDYQINNIAAYDDELWVFKENRPYMIQNDRSRTLDIGTDGLPGPEHGAAVTKSGLFLLWSWWKSIERKYGATIDDEGIWRGTGLPDGRSGYVCAMVSLLSWVFQGIDARDGTSSVYVWTDGYNEVFRGYKAGHRVRNIFSQSNSGNNPWLWISYNGELIYQEYSLTPLRETFHVQHEMVLESAIHDMGHADSYKFWKELVASTENLDGDGIVIELDYQEGKDVNTSSWTPVKKAFQNSPSDEVPLELGESQRIKYRLRMLTDTSTTIPIINALILKGYEVMPVKRLWNLRINLIKTKRGATPPPELYDFMWRAVQKASEVRMNTVIPGITDILVKLEPPHTSWGFIKKNGEWRGEAQLTVREM